jgi:hypothetical protein
MANSNPRRGSRFDDFLKEAGVFEEVQARVLKRTLAEQLGNAMQASQLSKVEASIEARSPSAAGAAASGTRAVRRLKGLAALFRTFARVFLAAGRGTAFQADLLTPSGSAGHACCGNGFRRTNVGFDSDFFRHG